jgi:PST family polysaccharide transporter
MGSSSLLVIALHLVQVKILAVLLGPKGVGALALFNQFHVFALTITGLGLSSGVVKYVASFESEGNQDATKRVITNSFQIIILIALSTFGVCVLLSSYLSGWIIGDSSYSYFVIIYALSLPLAVYPLIASSVLRGLKKIKSLAKINVLRSFISLLLIVPIVYFFRLEGAAVSVLIITTVHLLLTFFYMRREKRTYRVVGWQSLDRSIIKKLFPYGFASLLTGATYYLSHLLLKMIIVHTLGIEIAGIYQPIWALTMTYPAMVLTSMSAYAYPRLCELKTNRDIVEELNGIIRITLLLIVPVMCFLIMARKPIIQILYSSNFLEATEYMPVQIVGDFFRVLVWSTGIFFLPTKRIKAFIWLGVLPDTLLVILAGTLVVPYKLHGIVMGFAFCYLLTFLIYYWYSQKTIKFRFWRRNLKLFLASFGALTTITLVCRNFDEMTGLGINFLVIFIWSLLSIKKGEILQVKTYLNEKIFNKTVVISS